MNTRTIKNDNQPIFPFIQQVRNPFSDEPIIPNRPAGYRPIQYTNIEIVEDDEYLVPMYQSSCDIILPKNLKYRKTHELIMPP